VPDTRGDEAAVGAEETPELLLDEEEDWGET
jgi:hypothetical protein